MRKQVLKTVFNSTIIITLIISFTSNNVANAQEEIISGGDKGGKWVAYYAGGSEPSSCRCVSSFWKNKCFVGDIATDTSLCD